MPLDHDADSPLGLSRPDGLAEQTDSDGERHDCETGQDRHVRPEWRVAGEQRASNCRQGVGLGQQIPDPAEPETKINPLTRRAGAQYVRLKRAPKKISPKPATRKMRG